MPEKVQGILLHDIDVTDGPVTATVMMQGYINANRVDDSVKPLLDAHKDDMAKIHIIER